MKSLQSFASCCIAGLLTILVLSEVCNATAPDEGYKRGWRPQGRFGKRTLEQTPASFEDMIRPRTAEEDYIMDEGKWTFLKTVLYFFKSSLSGF